MHPIITGMLVEDRIATLRAEADAERLAGSVRRWRGRRPRLDQQPPTPPRPRIPEQRGSRRATVPARERVGA